MVEAPDRSIPMREIPSPPEIPSGSLSASSSDMSSVSYHRPKLPYFQHWLTPISSVSDEGGLRRSSSAPSLQEKLAEVRKKLVLEGDLDNSTTEGKGPNWDNAEFSPSAPIGSDDDSSLTQVPSPERSTFLMDSTLAASTPAADITDASYSTARSSVDETQSK